MVKGVMGIEIGSEVDRVGPFQRLQHLNIRERW